MWKIKKELYEGKTPDTGKLLMAVQASILMMDIGINDTIFKKFANDNYYFYDLFEKENNEE